MRACTHTHTHTSITDTAKAINTDHKGKWWEEEEDGSSSFLLLSKQKHLEILDFLQIPGHKNNVCFYSEVEGILFLSLL